MKDSCIRMCTLLLAMACAIAGTASSRPISLHPVSQEGVPPAVNLATMEDVLLSKGVIGEVESTTAASTEVHNSLDDARVNGDSSSTSYVNKHLPRALYTSPTKRAIDEPRGQRSPAPRQLTEGVPTPLDEVVAVTYQPIPEPPQLDSEEEENTTNSNCSTPAPVHHGCSPPAAMVELVKQNNYETSYGMLAMALSKMASDYKKDNYPITESEKEVGSVVCSQVEAMLQVTAPSNKTTSCPHQYQCSFDNQRYPKYIIEMVCVQEYCSSDCGGLNQCKPETVPFLVLKTDDDECWVDGSTSQWVSEMQTVDVGCSCAKLSTL